VDEINKTLALECHRSAVDGRDDLATLDLQFSFGLLLLAKYIN